jgi:AcrR family transcriptional regulator
VRKREPGRREENKAANRATILAAALDVFSIGYGTATVRDIIGRTGLASGTFYNYFPDKESVFARSSARARSGARTGPRGAPHGQRARLRRRRLPRVLDFVAQDPKTFQLERRNAGTIRALFDVPVIGAGVAELADDLRDGMASRMLAPHDPNTWPLPWSGRRGSSRRACRAQSARRRGRGRVRDGVVCQALTPTV